MRLIFVFFGFIRVLEGSLLLKTYRREGLRWPPAGKLWISGIQKVETLIFWILDPNCGILNKIGRKSSFTRPGGWIIDFSRSETCFSSCLASSIFFFYKKKVSFFLRSCVPTHNAHPPPTHSWTPQYRNNVSSRMANRYTRIFDAGRKKAPKDIFYVFVYNFLGLRDGF